MHPDLIAEKVTMRIIRFDSVGGASGDMILGALVGLGVDPHGLEATIRKLIPNETFRFKIEKLNYVQSLFSG